MPLSDNQIKDLVTGTLKNLGKLKFNQIAQKLVRYEVLGRILRKQKVQFDSGVGIQRTLMIDISNAAKNVGLYQKDVVNVGDVLATLDVQWRHTTTNYAWERRELLMNRSPSRIVDLVKVRRTDGILSLAELAETNFWNKPVDSTDKLQLFGVPYWVVSDNSEGFNGGDPSGFSAGAGNLAVATYPTWKNWTAQYTAVTKADAIKKMRKAYANIRFESPVDVPDYRRGRGDQYRIYVPYEVLATFEEVGEAQNENLGRDVASMDGTIAFRRNPIIWVPELDADASNPIYMLNYAYFHPVFLKGDYLRETEVKQVAEQHNVWVVHVDLTWNLLCTDRRRQAKLTL